MEFALQQVYPDRSPGDHRLPDIRLTKVDRRFNKGFLSLLAPLLSDDQLMHLAGAAEDLVRRRRARRERAVS